MIKIAYIELDTHAEIAGNFMELMSCSGEFSVDYYFAEKILNFLQIQSEHLQENIFKTTPENLLSQLSAHTYQLVIIGTVHRYFNVFEIITEKFNTSIICHNLNFVKTSNFDLFTSVFKEDFKYRLKLLLKEGLLRKSDVYKNANHLLVLDQTLAKENFKTLPVFYNRFSKKPQNQIFTIVIPGAVSQKRRDYFSVINKLFNQPLGRRIHLILLGKAKGKELFLLKDAEEKISDTISIQYFTEKIPQPIFDEWMENADLLWCPLQKKTEFFSQKEYYGITKMTGNVGDAIKYGKVAVFPADYPNSYPFIIPENENVEDQIHTYQMSAEYDFEQKFAKEKVLKSLENALAEML